jgi:hypothetical protein
MRGDREGDRVGFHAIAARDKIDEEVTLREFGKTVRRVFRPPGSRTAIHIVHACILTMPKWIS